MISCETLWTEGLGDLTNYAVGKAGSRYFFSWSEWRWPVQNEDGQDEVPADDIDDGTNGIHWYASLAEAIEDARGTIEVLDDVHPKWAEEALESLGDMVLTTGEAAAMLGVTEMRVRKLCQDGRMGYKVRQDGQWIIPLRDVEGFQRRKPGRPKKEPPYERKDEWGGYVVRKSQKGFVVEWWTARQGETTDAKYLVEYGDGYGPDTDLTSKHNELMLVGDYLYAVATDPAIGRVRVRTLRKGRIVR
ncbi:MAG TPA: helix-turn-helix domain-containing protein [Firmicutes bacterium]|nr:helix-turn-helix domain-containing protein [Candidatus Fermentithermobacillaceae bacterium]